MSKVYTSAVVIIPPRSCWEPIQVIRKKYDRQINRWMPHINLLYPFRPKSEFISLESTFSETCTIIEPFELQLNNFKFFHHHHEHYTIWLEPEPISSLKEFQLELLKIVPDCNDVNKHQGGFTPHLSVGQVNGRDTMISLMRELQTSWSSTKFELKKIFFISRKNEKKSKFQVEKTISLKIK
ncbi:MAG: 2'-5' RNA ligase family protein [Promethearchaeota archaeon]